MFFEKLTFPLTVERGMEAVEHVSKSSVRHSARREPLGVADFWLPAFILIYFAWP
jgi:hypothetical protein